MPAFSWNCIEREQHWRQTLPSLLDTHLTLYKHLDRQGILHPHEFQPATIFKEEHLQRNRMVSQALMKSDTKAPSRQKQHFPAFLPVCAT